MDNVEIIHVLTVAHMTLMAVHCVGKSSRGAANGTDMFHGIAKCCEHSIIVVSLSLLYEGTCSCG
jgi:hypothetical protein